MSELLLCKKSIAGMPYYIEGIAWNVYTIEELCYYIEKNTYLLESDFMTEELCDWLEKEIKDSTLAGKLRNIMYTRGSLSDFVFVLLTDCGYSPKSVVEEVISIIAKMEEKSDFERRKIRADRLLENGKYRNALYEYKSLLESAEAGEQNKELLGNIQHNLGTAYARLFLFEEAILCFEQAYEWNHNIESLKECIMACYCHYEKEEFVKAIEKYRLDERFIQEVKEKMDMAYNSEKLERFHNYFGSVVAQKALGNRKNYKNEIEKILFQWKEEYRRICRI